MTLFNFPYILGKQRAYGSTFLQVEYPSGEELTYPVLPYREPETSVSYCNVLAGTEESPDNVASLLSSMSLNAKVEGPDKLKVEVPPTR